MQQAAVGITCLSVDGASGGLAGDGMSVATEEDDASEVVPVLPPSNPGSAYRDLAPLALPDELVLLRRSAWCLCAIHAADLCMLGWTATAWHAHLWPLSPAPSASDTDAEDGLRDMGGGARAEVCELASSPGITQRFSCSRTTMASMKRNFPESSRLCHCLTKRL